MHEKPSTDSAAAAAFKCYAAPNQRSLSLGGRKSGGDRLEQANIYVNDGERKLIGSISSGPAADHGGGVGNNCASESLPVKLVQLHDCCKSDAFQLLNNRWAVAMSAHNNLPEDSAERPVLYARKNASAWGHAILPHLLIQPTGVASTGSQRDFLTELQQAMHSANSCPNP